MNGLENFIKREFIGLENILGGKLNKIIKLLENKPIDNEIQIDIINGDANLICKNGIIETQVLDKPIILQPRSEVLLTEFCLSDMNNFDITFVRNIKINNIMVSCQKSSKSYKIHLFNNSNTLIEICNMSDLDNISLYNDNKLRINTIGSLIDFKIVHAEMVKNIKLNNSAKTTE